MSEFPSNPAPYESPPPPRHMDPRVRRALPWVLAAALLLGLAGTGGVVTAYLVASMRAAPPPDAAFMPTPTPTVAPASSPEPPPDASPGGPQSTPTPPVPATPTAEPTPTPTPFVYVVQRGDSLFRIGQRFGVDPQAIIALNELRNPDRIFPGQELLIPAAGPTAPPSP